MDIIYAATNEYKLKVDKKREKVDTQGTRSTRTGFRGKKSNRAAVARYWRTKSLVHRISEHMTVRYWTAHQMRVPRAFIDGVYR